MTSNLVYQNSNFFERRVISKYTNITKDRLNKLFRYDPEKGLLYNRGGRGNRCQPLVGKVSGREDRLGYRRIWIGTDLFLAHILIWFIEKGSWPLNKIDHIDGNPSNNKIDNLRDVTQRINCSNSRKHREGSILGVRYIPRLNGFSARISCRRMTDNKSIEIYLGVFKVQSEAIEARNLALPYFT